MPVPLSQSYHKQRSAPLKEGFAVRLVQTVGLWPKRVFVQWTLQNPSTSVGHIFSVYRSGSSEGPWELVVQDLTDQYNYVDTAYPSKVDNTDPGLHTMRNILYYKIMVTGVDGDAEVSGKVDAGIDRRRAGILRKLRRDAFKIIQKGSGTEVAVLKRKWSGESCDCKSKTGMVVRAHCTSCNGTGIIHGYWDPVYTYATRSAEPIDNTTRSAGVVESHHLRVNLVHIPEVEPKDILIFLRDNRRYIVNRITPTEIHVNTVHQELDVSELSRSSVEYNLKVDRWHEEAWF